jgi:hypothetical protein
VVFRQVDVVEVREVLRGWLDGVGLRTVAAFSAAGEHCDYPSHRDASDRLSTGNLRPGTSGCFRRKGNTMSTVSWRHGARETYDARLRFAIERDLELYERVPLGDPERVTEAFQEIKRPNRNPKRDRRGRPATQ